jgi:chemotaxis protein MotB
MLKRGVSVALAIALLSLAGCAELKNLRKQNASLTGQVQSLEADKAGLLASNDELKAKNDGLQAALDQANQKMQGMTSDLAGLRQAEAAARQQADELRKIFKSLPVPVGVDERPEGNFVRFQSDILFAPGKDELTPDATAALDAFMGYLRDHPSQKIRIDGHTDGVPITRSGWKDNYHLSAMRALAVMRYLTSKGLDPSRAFIAGFGPNDPKVQPPEATADVPENRRVEVLLIPPKSTLNPAERIGRFGQ